MNALLTPIESCTEVAGLAPHEIVLGVSPDETHERLLAKYRCARRSRAMARKDRRGYSRRRLQRRDAAGGGPSDCAATPACAGYALPTMLERAFLRPPPGRPFT